MKNWKRWTAASVLALTIAMPGFANADDMMAKKFNYSGIETVMNDGMDLAPLRQVAESLGFKVTWNDMDRSILLNKVPSMDGKMMDKKTEDKPMADKMMDMGYSVKIQISNKTIMVGAKENMIAYAPMIINDKAYVTKDFVDMYLLNEMMMK
jgi:hypothetical protein